MPTLRIIKEEKTENRAKSIAREKLDELRLTYVVVLPCLGFLWTKKLKDIYFPSV